MTHFTNTTNPIDFPMTQEEMWPFPTNKPADIDTPVAVDFHSVMKEYNDIVKQLMNNYRAELLADAKEQGVGIVHINPSWLNKGGITIAFKKCSQYKSGSMVDVAVATCSKLDTFSRKTGATLALEKFFAGEVIQLPLLQTFPDEELSYVVKTAFSALYDYM